MYQKKKQKESKYTLNIILITKKLFFVAAMLLCKMKNKIKLIKIDVYIIIKSHFNRKTHKKNVFYNKTMCWNKNYIFYHFKFKKKNGKI